MGKIENKTKFRRILEMCCLFNRERVFFHLFESNVNLEVREAKAHAPIIIRASTMNHGLLNSRPYNPDRTKYFPPPLLVF